MDSIQAMGDSTDAWRKISPFPKKFDRFSLLNIFKKCYNPKVNGTATIDIRKIMEHKPVWRCSTFGGYTERTLPFSDQVLIVGPLHSKRAQWGGVAKSLVKKPHILPDVPQRVCGRALSCWKKIIQHALIRMLGKVNVLLCVEITSEHHLRNPSFKQDCSPYHKAALICFLWNFSYESHTYGNWPFPPPPQRFYGHQQEKEES